MENRNTKSVWCMAENCISVAAENFVYEFFGAFSCIEMGDAIEQMEYNGKS